MSIISQDFEIYNDFETIERNTLFIKQITFVKGSGNHSQPYSLVFPANNGINGNILVLNSSLELSWETPSNTIIPVAAVMPFAFSAISSEWLICDGAAVSRTTYANLFAAISTTFGVGDGSTTFNLPNMTNKFPRMKSAINNIGDISGNTTALPTTSFGGSTNTTGAHLHTLQGVGALTIGTISGPITGTNISNTTTINVAGSHNHTFTIDGGGDSETAPKHIIVLYCIKI